MNPFDLRALGRTDLKIPAFGFGTAPIGELFEKISESQSHATLQAAWESGIRYYDTSPFYGHGLSENRLGVLLRERRRSDFILSTKVGRVLTRFRGDPNTWSGSNWIGALPFELRFDYSYDGVMRSYEDSTVRMGLNRIDLLIIHDLDFKFHKTETEVAARLKELESGFKALEQLRSAGEIRGIGAGINEMGMMMRLLEGFDLDFFLVAMPYTLLQQEPLDREFPACQKRDVSVIIGAPFSSGILATGPGPDAKHLYKPASDEIQRKVEAMQQVCAGHNVSLKAAALQFLFGHSSVAAVIPGALAPEHVEQNLAAMREDIPAMFWDDLKQQNLIREDAPVP